MKREMIFIFLGFILFGSLIVLHSENNVYAANNGETGYGNCKPWQIAYFPDLANPNWKECCTDGGIWACVADTTVPEGMTCVKGGSPTGADLLVGRIGTVDNIQTCCEMSVSTTGMSQSQIAAAIKKLNDFLATSNLNPKTGCPGSPLQCGQCYDKNNNPVQCIFGGKDATGKIKSPDPNNGGLGDICTPPSPTTDTCKPINTYEAGSQYWPPIWPDTRPSSFALKESTKQCCSDVTHPDVRGGTNLPFGSTVSDGCCTNGQICCQRNLYPIDFLCSVPNALCDIVRKTQDSQSGGVSSGQYCTAKDNCKNSDSFWGNVDPPDILPIDWPGKRVPRYFFRNIGGSFYCNVIGGPLGWCDPDKLMGPVKTLCSSSASSISASSSLSKFNQRSSSGVNGLFTKNIVSGDVPPLPQFVQIDMEDLCSFRVGVGGQNVETYFKGGYMYMKNIQELDLTERNGVLTEIGDALNRGIINEFQRKMILFYVSGKEISPTADKSFSTENSYFVDFDDSIQSYFVTYPSGALVKYILKYEFPNFDVNACITNVVPQEFQNFLDGTKPTGETCNFDIPYGSVSGNENVQISDVLTSIEEIKSETSTNVLLDMNGDHKVQYDDFVQEIKIFNDVQNRFKPQYYSDYVWEDSYANNMDRCSNEGNTGYSGLIPV